MEGLERKSTLNVTALRIIEWRLMLCRREERTEAGDSFAIYLYCSGRDREWAHHIVVFVFEDMAVVHVVLRRSHTGRQVVLRAYRREVTRGWP